MSVSGVAGLPIFRVAGPRHRTAVTTAPIRRRSSNPPDQTGAPTTPFLGKITSSVTDSIMVSLPNGMSVGIAHFGGGSSGFDAQMLASLENLVGNLSSYTTTTKSTGDGNQPNAASDGSENTGSNSEHAGNAGDRHDACRPPQRNLRRDTALFGNPGSRWRLAAMNEMEKAMEELVDHFSGLGGSSGLWSTAANSAASQRALAAYAEQAKQKDQTALADGIGVSRES